jgi:hypothetical protein
LLEGVLVEAAEGRYILESYNSSRSFLAAREGGEGLRRVVATQVIIIIVIVVVFG